MPFRGQMTEFDFQPETPLLLSPPARHTFLVVEDDFTIQPLWETVIRRVDPNAVIRWSTSAEGAGRLIEDRKLVQDAFDFVIADVMLAGSATGIDLWKQYGERDSLFLFCSGLSVKKFADLVGDQKDRHPFLVRKPLDPIECIESVKAMLTFQNMMR